ncbi:MAG: hypothetical protein BGO67_12890 [Alphaproteobacteria bacterium 41-28]|nr:MAG: hypothetical protein BGO67_12890 [Alphaproteobacteria bacterium 41-28]
MRKFLNLRNISLLTFGGLVIFLFILFYDAFPKVKRFRTTQDEIKSTENIDLRGLKDIQASGGSLPGFPDLQKKLSHVKLKKIIVDAMYDYHGYILGMPTTSLAYHQDVPFLKHFLRRLVLTGTLGKRLDFITHESDEAKKYGFDYRAVNVGSKIKNTYEYIDDVVAFFESVPPNVWLHFHCRNGRGRTSMLLVMLDIMKNAPQVTLDNIVKRHILLGAEDLFNVKVWANGTYTAEELKDRKQFIEQFYEFVCQRKAGGIQRWSEWNRAQQKEI